MSKSSWQHRPYSSLEERFGLLDPVSAVKYKKHPVFQEPRGESPKHELTAFGFTSGVGSMLIGARDNGFRVAGNIEWRDSMYSYAANKEPSTFIRNFPGAFLARGPKDVPKDLIPTTIDFATGHPECGCFSLLSKPLVNRSVNYAARATDVSDIPLFLKYIKEYQPRFFLMDDLPKSFAALPMSEYVKLLPNYDLFPEWVDNWAYGNVQKYRKRMFIVGALKSENYIFVPGEKAHSILVKDVIGDLIDSVGDGTIANHATVDLQSTTGRFANIRFLGDRPTYAELRDYMMTKDKLLRGNKPYYKEDGTQTFRPGTTDPKWEGNCPVLSGGYNPLHPIRWTPMSLRERARIQGFPDDFTFYTTPNGPFEKLWDPYKGDGIRGVKQTGKAMPIQFCAYVAKQVKDHINGNRPAFRGTRTLDPNVDVTDAKQEFCKLSGYSDQARACGSCWHKPKCKLEQRV